MLEQTDCAPAEVSPATVAPLCDEAGLSRRWLSW
jgi:hypothetical protein